MIRWMTIPAVLAAAVLLPLPARGGDETPAEDLQAKIEKLVARLGAEVWKDRELATRELIKIGKPAIPALEKAAKSEDPEVRIRARGALDLIRGGEAGRAEAPEGEGKPQALPPPSPFPVPDPFNRDFAEWIKKLLEDPFGPLGERDGEWNRDLQRMLQALKERNARQFGFDGSQKSVISKDGKTVEVERDAKGGIRVVIRGRDAEGRDEAKTLEAQSEEAFRKAHPEAWDSYVKDRFSPFRLRVLQGRDPFDDWWKDFDQEFRDFRKRWDPEQRWREMEKRMRKFREGLQGQGLAGGTQHVVVQSGDETLEWKRETDGRVQLVVKRRDENGNAVEDRYEAPSEEEFKTKFPDVHAKLVEGRLGRNGLRIELGPGLRVERAAPAPGFGVEAGEVSPLLRAQLNVPEGRGFVVTRVAPGSLAEKAGIEQWDLVLSAGGKPVRGPAEVLGALERNEGDLALEIVRRGERTTVVVRK